LENGERNKKSLFRSLFPLFSFFMRNNRLILILIFFGIGYFLFYKDKEGPLGKLWGTITGVFKSKEKPTSENPYKAPEPDTEASATNNKSTAESRQSSNSETEKDTEVSIFDKIKDKVFNNEPEQSSSSDNELPDFALPAIRKGEQIIKHKNYTLRYEEDHEQAAWVAHKLRGEYTKGKANRSGLQFQPDSKVKTQSALSSDYSNSGYDRGHLVPAGDFKCCQDLLEETFYVSNLSPQVPQFNQGIWENIESRVRGWSNRDEELFIVTGPVLKKGLPTIGRFNKVSVPEQYYKIVLFYQPNSGKKPRAIAFLLPNEALLGKRMNNFVVPIDEVERITGIDFFAKLPDEIESKLEAESSWEAWTKIQ
jgi:endonuclease G, mitochondrial